MASITSTYLQKSRTELLDLGLRNPLINFRTRARIDIVDEISKNIYEILVSNSKEMKFLPVPEAEMEDINNSIGNSDGEDVDWVKRFAASEAAGSADSNRHTDRNLQTNLSPSDLKKRLITLHSGARTFIEEQGINVLYLALGFLHWIDEKDGQIRKAPLILVPVELLRGSAREKFTLSYNQTDIGANLSLIEKMSSQYGIKIPRIDDPDDFKVDEYFEQVTKVIKYQINWSLHPNEIALSFFSFGKFVMYEDLDERKWPEEKQPSAHPILSGLTDPQKFLSATIPDSGIDIDETIKPGEVIQVRDSDSSQTKAQIDIRQGFNLVIQGPPGTGKSQTITNIIADAIYTGKKVLFVAEKLAALEVVKRRLDNLELGDAVLELHSHKANKKQLLTELSRTWNLQWPIEVTDESNIGALKYSQEKLNEFVRAMNLPVLKSNLTPVEIIGKLSQLRAVYPNPPLIQNADLQNYSEEEYARKLLTVQDIMGRMRSIGDPSVNVFFGVKLDTEQPLKLNTIRELIKETIIALKALRSNLLQLEDYGFSVSETFVDAENFIKASERYNSKPRLANTNLLVSLLKEYQEVVKIHQSFKKFRGLEDLLTKKADLQQKFDNVKELYNIESRIGNKWWRFLNGDYRRMLKRARVIFQRGQKMSQPERLTTLENLCDYLDVRDKITRDRDKIADLTGADWEVFKRSPESLDEIISWIKDLRTDKKQDDSSRFLRELILHNYDIEKFETTLEKLKSNSRNALDLIKRLSEELIYSEFTPKYRLHRRIEKNLPETIQILEKWDSNFSELQIMVRYNSLLNTLKQEKLTYLEVFLNGWDEAGTNLVAAFQYSYYQMLLDHAYSSNPAIGAFDKSSHEDLMQTYRTLDRRQLEINRHKVAMKHWEMIPRSSEKFGQMNILQREMNKKRNLLPIRQLMSQAGEAIKQIKPVFMMGPMSVASFLPPEVNEFDLVIFDEASQVKPVDAFGAILRGKQVVVIGDTKQLPPTSFFETMNPESDEDEEFTSSSADSESILNLFLAKDAPSNMLKWHYRSRHESLIAVSNKEFYNNDLIVFPNPGSRKKNIGLSFVHLPETQYLRGTKRCNPGEARAVAKAVMEHIRTSPENSLGIAAFSSSQRDAIELEIELLRTSHPELEFFFSSHPDEPFFVKNLENVQGDERDVIFISIGYGRVNPGEALSMIFGPLNKDGGERRLNVLISRAKLCCRVFSNFRYLDMDLSRSQATGVAALRSFLQYAETGEFERGNLKGNHSSSFVNHVVQRLADKGFQVIPNLGISEYRIDIAVKDTRAENDYLIGIECDGRNFASARSARDRTRLRKEVLEQLGWRLHRIWSLEWYRNEDAEFNNLLKVIEDTQKGIIKPPVKVEAAALKESTFIVQHSQNVNSDTHKTAANHSIPKSEYRIYNKPVNIHAAFLHSTRPDDLIKWIVDIVEFEGPIQNDLLKKRITNGVGLQKVGERIDHNLSKAIRLAITRNSIVYDDGFLSIPGKTAVLRDRTNLDQNLKKVELIPPVELSVAMTEVVKSAFTVPDDELISASFRLLGFQKVTSQMKELGKSVISQSLKDGKLKRDSFGRIAI